MTFISLLLVAAVVQSLGHSVTVDMGIVNGHEAKPHSRPYMVSVQRNSKHVCGGFLLTEQFVMTSAHCWNWTGRLTVVLGAHELPQDKSSGHMAVKFYHIHPMYDSQTQIGDIMLLQLNGQVKKSKTIKRLSIPTSNKDIKANSACSVAGWGKIETNGRYSKVLREVNVTVKDKKECEKKWKKEYSAPSMVCAGGHGSFCQGDSGGPLVCNGIAVGIAAFTDDKLCNSTKRPNVYIRISEYLPWINGILKSIR